MTGKGGRSHPAWLMEDNAAAGSSAGSSSHTATLFSKESALHQHSQ